VLASNLEQDNYAGFVKDPLNETQKNPVPGLIHKYTGRVLMLLTGACAINCRFCFRRHFPYSNNNPGRSGWQRVFSYLAEDISINEVILSGGDPLLANDVLMQNVFQELSLIPHLKTIRIHTRIPVVLPERINEDLLKILSTTRFKIIIVLHCNHPQEISLAMEKACLDLYNIGCFLLNQTVFLKGVNDNSQTLQALSYRLFDLKVMPYYLHLLDKTKGTQHFWVADRKAKKIFQDLKASLPGYLVPKLVREEPSMTNKTWIN
jgi:EF-P beta-lysylation protein EpmB